MPRAMFSSVSMSMYASSSRARSMSQRVRRKYRSHSRMDLLAAVRYRRAYDILDRAHERSPSRRLLHDLLPPDARQPIETRAAIVVGGAPVGADPAAALEPVQRRVQRP